MQCCGLLLSYPPFLHVLVSVLFGAKIYNIIYNTHWPMYKKKLVAIFPFFFEIVLKHMFLLRALVAWTVTAVTEDNNFRQPTSIIKKRMTHKK